MGWGGVRVCVGEGERGEGGGEGSGKGGEEVVVVVVVRTVQSQRRLWRYHCMRATNSGGRSPGSQTPGRRGTSEQRE